MPATPAAPKTRLRDLVANYRFWLIVVMLAAITYLQYTPQVRLQPLRIFGESSHLTRHAAERVLLVMPITLSALTFGMRAGLLTSLVALLVMLPRLLFLSPYPVDAFFEMIAVALVGGLVSWLARIERRALQQSRSAERELRYYVGQVTRAQEDERKRIAREIHDDTAQLVLVLSRRLDALATSDPDLPEATRLRLEELRELSGDILTGLRRFSHDLRPPVLDDLGLLPALRELTAHLPEGKLRVRLEVVGRPRQLSSDTELALFRIAQEALTNIRKHSGASEATVAVEFGDAVVRVSVSDNGGGFAPPERLTELAQSGKMGLIGMQERAQLLGGTLTLRSQPGRGATVIVDVPL